MENLTRPSLRLRSRNKCSSVAGSPLLLRFILEQANLLPVKPEKVKASSSMHSVLDDHSAINVTSLPTAKRPHRADTDVVMDATMDYIPKLICGTGSVWRQEGHEVCR